MIPVLVTLGSNINKEINVPKAIEKIRSLPEISLEAVSEIYETSPIGSDGQKSNQPVFYNAAVLLQTMLSADELRDRLRKVESQLERVRSDDKFAARTIDIDIAFYGRELFAPPGNPLPDLDIIRFAHLAVPLADIAPTWVHPSTGQTLRTVADHLISDNAKNISKVEIP